MDDQFSVHISACFHAVKDNIHSAGRTKLTISRDYFAFAHLRIAIRPFLGNQISLSLSCKSFYTDHDF